MLRKLPTPHLRVGSNTSLLSFQLQLLLFNCYYYRGPGQIHWIHQGRMNWENERRFLRTGVDRYALEEIVQRVRHDRLARAPRYPCRTVCLFVDFSYVRPEPVLANVRVLESSGIGHRRFRTEGEHCRGLQHAAE